MARKKDKVLGSEKADQGRASVMSPGVRTAMSDEESWRLDELREEARYRRERLQLYRARMYGGRSASDYRLREYERASEGASARLSRAEARLASGSEQPNDPTTARTDMRPMAAP